ncbi:MAG: L,D-transpeptidase [Cyanobium sp. CZS 25K]|nr:L,D-transpeptidase [Cyanobium sp. CZS25K]
MSRSLALCLLLTTGWGAAMATAARAVEPPLLVPTAAASSPAILSPTPGSPAGPGQASPSPATPAPEKATVTSTREIVLELGKRTISLRDNGKVLGSWPVAIGDSRTPTPKGRFLVETKVVNPQYQSTASGKINPTKGPNGPLGDRWIGFKKSGPNQYGIHGTPSAWAWTVTSRSAVTNGCVRMLTPHVRALFDQVDVGTPVVVKP